MNIKINRTITTRLYTMGELFINGSKTTLTVEDTLTMLEPGIYRQGTYHAHHHRLRCRKS